jgi:hypothetical protein
MLRIIDARDISWAERKQHTNARGAERQTGHASRARQHHALGQQLPHDLPAAGAERGADRKFPVSSGGAREQ